MKVVSNEQNTITSICRECCDCVIICGAQNVDEMESQVYTFTFSTNAKVLLYLGNIDMGDVYA